MASVIHQIVINKATPAVNHPILLRLSGGSENINIDSIKIDTIIGKDEINHDMELNNLEILFKKVENDN